jgi:glyoxylate/hydroxypyruvate reductase
MQILIKLNLSEDAKCLIQENVKDADLIFSDPKWDDQTLLEAFLSAEVVFGNVPAQWLPKTAQLKWMQLITVGVGQYKDTIQATQTISNMHSFGKEVITETILGGLLTLYRRLDELSRLQIERDWQMFRIRLSAKKLYGSKVIVLGAGSIGGHLRPVLEALGCSVVLFAKQSQVELRSLDDLDNYLPEADIVIGCLPHVPETVGMINANRLSHFKDGAIFVNVGRGSLVDEEALIEALQNGKLGGAVLDVTANEPLPTDSPLWTCTNTILTQHTSGGYANELIDKTHFFLNNLQRYQAGEPVWNIVDFEKGY